MYPESAEFTFETTYRLHVSAESDFGTPGDTINMMCTLYGVLGICCAAGGHQAR